MRSGPGWRLGNERRTEIGRNVHRSRACVRASQFPGGRREDATGVRLRGSIRVPGPVIDGDRRLGGWECGGGGVDVDRASSDRRVIVRARVTADIERLGFRPFVRWSQDGVGRVGCGTSEKRISRSIGRFTRWQNGRKDQNSQKAGETAKNSDFAHEGSLPRTPNDESLIGRIAVRAVSPRPVSEPGEHGA
jgi:hypothetical protein